MDDTSGGGGGGSSGGEQGELPSVTLTINSIGGGSTLGTGTYEWGATVSVMAISDLGSTFIQWTGGLSSYGSDLGFSFQIFSDASGTAVFHRYQPCRDLMTANPLMNMLILGSKNNGIPGGRFGSGRGTPHYGIDLAAPVGTPIYAMFDGIVEQCVNWYDQNTPWDQYETQYSGYNSKCSNAGNRVRIKSSINGEDVYLKYMHLNQIDLSVGDIITAGAIIGTVGTTGSACSPKSNGAHLHLEVLINGISTIENTRDPEPYLYTTFAPMEQ